MSGSALRPRLHRRRASRQTAGGVATTRHPISRTERTMCKLCDEGKLQHHDAPLLGSRRDFLKASTQLPLRRPDRAGSAPSAGSQLLIYVSEQEPCFPGQAGGAGRNASHVGHFTRTVKEIGRCSRPDRSIASLALACCRQLVRHLLPTLRLGPCLECPVSSAQEDRVTGIFDPAPRTPSDEEIRKAQAIRQALRRELLSRAEQQLIPRWLVGAE